MKKEEKEKREISKESIVCRIGDIIIAADQYQYKVHGFGQTTFHSTIEEVLDELLESKEKTLMQESEEKTLVSIHDSIKEARKWLNKEVKPLFK